MKTIRMLFKSSIWITIHIKLLQCFSLRTPRVPVSSRKLCHNFSRNILMKFRLLKTPSGLLFLPLHSRFKNDRRDGVGCCSIDYYIFNKKKYEFVRLLESNYILGEKNFNYDIRKLLKANIIMYSTSMIFSDVSHVLDIL